MKFKIKVVLMTTSTLLKEVDAPNLKSALVVAITTSKENE
jgi:hypothetical protein